MAKAKVAGRDESFIEITVGRKRRRGGSQLDHISRRPLFKTGHKNTEEDRCTRADRLSRYWEAQMSPEEHEEMNVHLAGCRHCRNVLDDMSKTLKEAEKSRR